MKGPSRGAPRLGQWELSSRAQGTRCVVYGELTIVKSTRSPCAFDYYYTWSVIKYFFLKELFRGSKFQTIAVVTVDF